MPEMNRVFIQDFLSNRGIRCDLYYDMFVFPWLKYRLNGPSHGRDILFQFTVRPDKFWQLTATYKQELKPVDGIDPANRSVALMYPVKQKLRIASELNISKSLQLPFGMVAFTFTRATTWLYGKAVMT
jgi:hypothetical protein